MRSVKLLAYIYIGFFFFSVMCELLCDCSARNYLFWTCVFEFVTYCFSCILAKLCIFVLSKTRGSSALPMSCDHRGHDIFEDALAAFLFCLPQPVGNKDKFKFSLALVQSL